MTLRRFVAVLLLLSVCTCLFSCETADTDNWSLAMT